MIEVSYELHGPVRPLHTPYEGAADGRYRVVSPLAQALDINDIDSKSQWVQLNSGCGYDWNQNQPPENEIQSMSTSSRSRLPMRNSLAIQENIVLPGDTNAHDTLFGGLLMKRIDETAAISARRHSWTAVVTASNDGVHFHRPIQNNDIVILESYVCSVGRTSMEVFVKILTEHRQTETQREIAAISFLTFVALGNDGKPIEVPDIYPESAEEELLYRDREIRKEARLKKRDETNDLIAGLVVKS